MFGTPATGGYRRCRRSTYVVIVTFHMLEWARMEADRMFLLVSISLWPSGRFRHRPVVMLRWNGTNVNR
jgi:hypothetical protein